MTSIRDLLDDRHREALAALASNGESATACPTDPDPTGRIVPVDTRGGAT